MIVLDTNVVSEIIKLAPEAEVLVWFASQARDSIFIAATSEAELRFGLAILPPGKRRDKLTAAITGILEQDFVNRILPFDSRAARHFASIAGHRQQLGRPMSQSDAQIAAVAQCHGASVATRNTSDFVYCGVPLINPWKFNPRASKTS